MLPLKYKKNEAVEDKFYEMVVANRNEEFITEIDEKCKKYLKKSFKEIVCASPKTLDELHTTVKTSDDYEQIKKDFKHICSEEKENNYIVKTLYHGLSQEAKQLIYNQVGLKTCPYCNRNFVEKLEISTAADKSKSKFAGTFELDHFYSKNEFPMFAVSFYNLIPACGICNRIKEDKEFMINPYLMKSEDHIFFEYDILGSEYMSNEEQLSIKISSSSENALKDAENLHLTEIYNGHKDVVCEIIKKAKYYSPQYIESLFNETEKLFEDEEELYRLLYEGYADPDEFGKRPVSKFIKDIYSDTIKNIGGFDVLKTK